MTLDDLSANGIYVWYNNISTEKTVEIVNYLKEQAEDGKQIFYNIYTEEEQKSDPSKQDTGLFFFPGRTRSGICRDECRRRHDVCRSDA